jgi:hypothetical protein
MFDTGSKPVPKMSTRYKGPHEVVHHTANDVQCRNLVTGAIQTYSTEDLEPFHGTKQQAYEASLRDKEQFVVSEVRSYAGDSTSRTKMTFVLQFADGDVRTLPWTADIQCEAYYKFCESRPYLFHLTLEAEMARRFMVAKRKEEITTIALGDSIFVELRAFGDLSYQSLNLPEWSTTSYVIEAVTTRWYNRTNKRVIAAKHVLSPYEFHGDAYWIFAWTTKEFDQSRMTLVDRPLLVLYPDILTKHLT